MIRRQVLPALMMMIVLTVMVGLAYPLAVTGVAQAAMGSKADGSLITVNGTKVGSSLIGQNFAEAKYFHPRPSAAGEKGYDAMASAGTNLGPTNPALITAITDRVTAYRSENNLAESTQVPIDAVTTSGSGLDPQISIANAEMQTARVAGERGLGEAQVAALVKEHTDGRDLGFLGQPAVNVLELNVALDAAR